MQIVLATNSNLISLKVRPEPKPEEPVQFSVTIGPRKEYERKAPLEGYFNPMKVI
jgi:hypothetical protein